jgi:hypothetical protein
VSFEATHRRAVAEATAEVEATTRDHWRPGDGCEYLDNDALSADDRHRLGDLLDWLELIDPEPKQ